MAVVDLRPYVVDGYWVPGYAQGDIFKKTDIPKPTKGFYDRRLDGTEVVYVDFDFGMNIHPVTRDFILRTNEKAILQSLRNCVLSAEGDFPMEGDIGGGLDRMLFDNNDAMIAFNARRKIEETVNNHETRIELESVEVRRSDNSGLEFDVEFMFANRTEPVQETIRVDRRR